MTATGDRSSSVLTSSAAGIAGLAFVVIGVIELALTQGAIPSPTVDPQEMSVYLEGAQGTAPAVALLSGGAAISLLIFATGLRHRLATVDTTLANLAWIAAGVTVALALAGQAVQQAAIIELGNSTAANVTALGSLVGFLFLFAVLAGGTMAAAAGVAGLRSGTPARWIGVLGVLVLGIELVLLAMPKLSGAGFPAFIVWLVIFSVWMLRHRDAGA